MTLEVGRTYEAIGPAHGSKLGPPPRVTIIGLTAAGDYRTEAPRQPASVIKARCAGNYRPVD